MEELNLEHYIYGGQKSESPASGRLLLAQPLMEDPHFSRTAVYLLDDPPGKGYIGLIMNRKTDVTMGDLIPDWEEGKQYPVYIGGPVDQGRLFMIHTLGNSVEGAMELSPGIFVGGDLGQIISKMKEGVTGMRFFLGYCGWTEGQLERELRERSWAVQTDVDSRTLLEGVGNDYWRREVGRLGPEFKNWLSVPEIPDLN